MSWILPLIIGLLTGIISGLGIGGGSLLILYLTTFAGIEQLAAAGINLLYFLFCAPAALVSHIKNKMIEKKAVLFTTASGIVTSVAASLVVSYLDISWLRRGFGVLLLYIGVKELFCKKETESKETCET